MVDNEDSSLFKQAMQSVKPLKKLKTIPLTPPKSQPPIKMPSISLPQSFDNLNTQYYSVVKKAPTFQPCITINYTHNLDDNITSQSILKFNTQNISAKQLEKLIKGQFAIDARIDLHGIDRFEAQERLNRFINHAKSHGIRNLLVIHGKGSKHGETPILKSHIYKWLQNNPLLLAMHSAHPKHGGSGALYVLLKKKSLTY